MKADISTLLKPDILILRRHMTLRTLRQAETGVSFRAYSMDIVGGGR